jgi:HD superfamily phosphodiesterase
VSDVAELIVESLKYRCTPDIVRTGALLHDIARFGTGEKGTEHSLNNHPLLGSSWVADVGHRLVPSVEEDKLQEVCNTIRSHMGRWHDPSPDSVNEVLVHLADVIAAGYIPVRGEILE